MNILTAIDSQTISIIALVCTIAFIWLYSDIKEILFVYRIRKISNQADNKKKAKRITVLIELDDTVEKILPALDGLYSQAYPNLEVIILIQPSATKQASASLAAYRRTHNIKLLKCVRLTKTMTTEKIIRQKVTGELIIPLSASSKLSKNFFSTIAKVSLDKEADILMPRQHLAPGTSLLSALFTTKNVLQYAWSRYNQINLVKGLQPGYVYRRDNLLRRPSMEATMHCTLSYTVSVTTTQPSSPSFVQSVKSFSPFNKSITPILITGAILLFIMAFVSEQTGLSLIIFLPIGYVALLMLFISGIKEYTVVERGSLILFAPFSILFFAGMSLLSVNTRICSTIKNTRASAIVKQLASRYAKR